MKIGYGRTLSKKENQEKVKATLRKNGVEELFIETYREGDKNLWKRREFSEALRYLQAGDTLVVMSLEEISRQYRSLIELLSELSKRSINLEVLHFKKISMTELAKLLVWVERNEEQLQRTVTTFKINRETAEKRKKYHFRSKDRESRYIYWKIIQELVSNKSLRTIARELNVSRGTVYRIKKQYNQLKQTIFLVGMFIITIISLKLAQSYSSNVLIQLLICGVTTLGIVYFSYSDSQSE